MYVKGIFGVDVLHIIVHPHPVQDEKPIGRVRTSGRYKARLVNAIYLIRKKKKQTFQRERRSPRSPSFPTCFRHSGKYRHS